MEKISFIYTHEIREGDPAMAVRQPEPWIKVSDFPVRINLGIIFGLFIRSYKTYRIVMDVFHEDVSIMDDTKNKLSPEPLVAASPSADDYISIETMALLGLNIKNEGVHKVACTIYSSPVPMENEKVLHSTECYFFVSKTIGAK
ncbi:TPA: hypothetical protein PXL93_004353 [Yersinia enterocolitica]|nr:hypothetical protein [Yersinia enterocolitica]HDL6901598.1 hypothetical protein [Yersinia enterocolitica]